MSIPFSEVPGSVYVPNVYIEIDTTRADQDANIQPYKILAIGQRLSGGTVAAGVLTQVISESLGRKYFGAGSQLAQMIQKIRDVNKSTEIWAVGLNDDGAATDATATITFTGTATENGTLNIYIGGRQYRVAVLTTDTVTSIASAVAAEVTADDDAIVTAGSALGVVTFTTKNAGVAGNEIDIRLNYYSDETTPAGLTATVAGFSGGATNPNITTALSALTEDQYNIICMPYTDSSNLTILDNELDDRWGPIRQNFGVTILAKRDTYSNLSSFASPKNSKNYAVMGMDGPNSPWEWAAQIAGRVALAAQIDPARPFQTLSLPTLLAPAESELFTWTERDNLLADGISTYTTVGGTVNIERLRTLYKLNAAGADDDSLSDVEPLLTLEYIRYDLKRSWQLTFPRAKLANDGTRFSTAQGMVIVTPKTAKAFLLTKFRQWEELGLVEDFDQFKKDLIVERNTSDKNRLDVLLPANLVNQLRVSAFLFQFRL